MINIIFYPGTCDHCSNKDLVHTWEWTEEGKEGGHYTSCYTCFIDTFPKIEFKLEIEWDIPKEQLEILKKK